MKTNRFLLYLISVILFPITLWAIGKPSCISTAAGKDFFKLSVAGISNPLYISSNEFPRVTRVSKDLQFDVNIVISYYSRIIYNKLIAPEERSTGEFGIYLDNLYWHCS